MKTLNYILLYLLVALLLIAISTIVFNNTKHIKKIASIVYYPINLLGNIIVFLSLLCLALGRLLTLKGRMAVDTFKRAFTWK